MMEGFLQQWLAWRRKSAKTVWQQRLWWIFEWIAAWILICGFSLWYLYEYVTVNFQAWQGNFPLTTQIPATTIPQTRSSQRKTVWEESYAEFHALLQAVSKEDQVGGNQDQDWICMLRKNGHGRELASFLLLRPPPTTLTLTDKHRSTMATLHRIWPHVLKLPDAPSLDTYAFSISLIIPAFNVSPNDLQALLQHTERHCQQPECVQVIIVTAGDTALPSESTMTTAKSSRFQNLEVYSYVGTNGRGGCLNYGASHARGAIMTFLHSDTLLPENWDQYILRALLPKHDEKSITTTLCAFSMGIDMTPFVNQEKNQVRGDYPMGLWGADHVLGYLRCTVSRLPYGDSVLSLPSYIFNYLGGYPEQPLMEDYALVQLVRRRALQFSKEQICILKPRIACSPRRWQQHGVPYVIMANAYCIYRYKVLKTPAEELFEFYYHRSSSAIASTSSTAPTAAATAAASSKKQA